VILLTFNMDATVISPDSLVESCQTDVGRIVSMVSHDVTHIRIWFLVPYIHVIVIPSLS
jgi:hypothetical protein